MNAQDIKMHIVIGLSKPKYYKRSVWNRSVRIMEFLCKNTTDIRRVDSEEGLEKYATNCGKDIDAYLTKWAKMYRNRPLSECVKELNGTGIKLNSRKGLEELLIK